MEGTSSLYFLHSQFTAASSAFVLACSRETEIWHTEMYAQNKSIPHTCYICEADEEIFAVACFACKFMNNFLR